MSIMATRLYRRHGAEGGQERLRISAPLLMRTAPNDRGGPSARWPTLPAMAGMAFANAFLGVSHSMAHKLGAYHHLPHGVANALL